MQKSTKIPAFSLSYLLLLSISIVFFLMACEESLDDLEKPSTGIINMLNSEDIKKYTIELNENDSLIKSNGDYFTSELPISNGGPVISSVNTSGTVIPGGTLKLNVSFDRITEYAIVNLKNDTGYYKFPVNSNNAEIEIHFSYKMKTELQSEFDNSLDEYCNNGNFQIPKSLEGINRYTDYFDKLGITANLLCKGDSFIGNDYISAKDLSTLFPARVEQTLEIRGESEGKTGEAEEARIDIQDVSVGDFQVSLWFDQETDLDLHVIEPDNTEIYYANTKSKSGGFLDLDSNPACFIDKVNNENIYWNKLNSGTHEVILHYWKACTSKPVNWIISIRQKNTLYVFSGSMTKNNENEYWKIATFSQ